MQQRLEDSEMSNAHYRLNLIEKLREENKVYKQFQGSQQKGLAEDWIADNYIMQSMRKHCTFVHPVSGRPERARQRELRMVVFALIISSLGEYKYISERFYYGDCR